MDWAGLWLRSSREDQGFGYSFTPLQAHTTYFAKKFEERGQFSHYFFSHLEGEWKRHPKILFKLQEKLNKTLKLG